MKIIEKNKTEKNIDPQTSKLYTMLQNQCSGLSIGMFLSQFIAVTKIVFGHHI